MRIRNIIPAEHMERLEQELAHLASHISVDKESGIHDKADHMERLEQKLAHLVSHIRTINSWKEEFYNQILEMSETNQLDNEYDVLAAQIGILGDMLVSFLSDYGDTTVHSLIPKIKESEKSASSATGVRNKDEFMKILESDFSVVIDTLKLVKPKIWKTHIGNFSEDLAGLCAYANLVSYSLKQESMILQKRLEADPILHFTKSYVDKVLNYLEEEDVKRICIVGPAGVGKTKVMKKLKDRLSPRQINSRISFKPDYVIWISFPHAKQGHPNHFIRDMILTKFKIDKNAIQKFISVDEMIYRLLLEKKYIILIDQVPSNIDLELLGIPQGNKFGKVVVAYNDSVSINRKWIDRKIKMKGLETTSALKHFYNIYGEIKGERIREIAMEIILKGCGGLPLAIELLAVHLKGNTDESAWIQAKQILGKEPVGFGYANRVRYELLGNKLKKCFLYGSLFPIEKEINKDYLIECWMAEGFLNIDDDDTHFLRAARDHGETVLKELTDRHLLEWCSDHSDEFVKMPIYFREPVLRQKIPDEKDGKLWVPPARGAFLLPQEETWKTATRMSLINSALGDSDLPKSPESEVLYALLLQSSWIIELPDLLFHHMKRLKILDLQYTLIRSLPHSVSNLKNLISLYLKECVRLTSLPPQVIELQKLGVLDIRTRSIKPWLPQEIGELVSLRCLRASFRKQNCYHNLKEGKTVGMRTSWDIIGNLKKLEELIIETDVSNCWENITDKITRALANLEELTTLHFHFKSGQSLEYFIKRSKSWNNQETPWRRNTFRSFRLFMGDHLYTGAEDIIRPGLAERYLCFRGNEGISAVDKVLKQASAFELINNDLVKTLSAFHLKDWSALKVCVLKLCPGLRSVVEKADGGVILQSLVQLHLYNLTSLRCIWEGSNIPPRSLSRLRVLKINSCRELTEFLTPSLARALSSLEELDIQRCPKLVKIVMAEEPQLEQPSKSNVEIVVEEEPQLEQQQTKTNVSRTVDLSDVLHRLKCIKLVALRELNSICDSASISWNSLLEVEIRECTELRNLSLTPANARQLESITCAKSWWVDTIQLPNEDKKYFSHLCHFTGEADQWDHFLTSYVQPNRASGPDAWADKSAASPNLSFPTKKSRRGRQPVEELFGKGKSWMRRVFVFGGGLLKSLTRHKKSSAEDGSERESSGLIVSSPPFSSMGTE